MFYLRVGVRRIALRLYLQAAAHQIRPNGKRVVANLNSSFDSGEHRSCRERNTSDFQFNLDELVVDL